MAQEAGEGRASALAAFALGSRVIDSIMGDLAGEGRDEALLVLDPARGTPEGRRHPLEVVLLRRDAAGQLRRAATNDRLLTRGPHAAIGGQLRAQPGSFTVIENGGAMRANYRFDYDKRAREWFLAHVSRYIADSDAGGERRQELDARDLGRVAFVRFNPARLPLFNGEKSK